MRNVVGIILKLGVWANALFSSRDSILFVRIYLLLVYLGVIYVIHFSDS
jgi:hypothetical protein